MKQHSIQYGTTTIDFDLFRADRKTLAISVYPDLRVTVTAPDDAKMPKILDKVRGRAKWICKQKRYFDQFQPRTTQRKYISGETHLYLGKRYRLKVISAETVDLKLSRGLFQLKTPKPDDLAHNKKIMLSWYREKADQWLSDRFDHCFQPFQQQGMDKPSLQIRKFDKRWGSYYPKSNRLALNPSLIRAPVHCIDYVITHELCHLRHPNHNREFYEFLNFMMTDWKERKIELERRLS